MRNVITAALAIHIVFCIPIEERYTKIMNTNADDKSYKNGYEISNGIKQDQIETFRNTETGNVILNAEGFLSIAADDTIYFPDNDEFRSHITTVLRPRSPYANCGSGGSRTVYQARSGIVNANRISSKSDGSGCRENNEALRYPDSNGSSRDNKGEDENAGVAIIESRINRNCLKTIMGSRFKEDVTLEPSISNKTKPE